VPSSGNVFYIDLSMAPQPVDLSACDLSDLTANDICVAGRFCSIQSGIKVLVKPKISKLTTL